MKKTFSPYFFGSRLDYVKERKEYRDLLIHREGYFCNELNKVLQLREGTFFYENISREVKVIRADVDASYYKAPNDYHIELLLYDSENREKLYGVFDGFPKDNKLFNYSLPHREGTLYLYQANESQLEAYERFKNLAL